MQEGIGRGGYRILSFVFCGLGLVGLLMAMVGGGGVSWILGLLLAAVALVALAGLVTVTLGLPAAVGANPFRVAPRSAPDGEDVVPLPTPEPPAVADPSADIGFEYADETPAPAPAPAPASMAAPPMVAMAPMAMAPPESRPMFERSLPPPPPRPASRTPPPRMARPHAGSAPPSGKSAADATGWPERKGKAGVTRRQLVEGVPRDPGPTVEVEGPGPVRREPPIVMARTVASAEATGIPDGAGVGKCGNCGVLLLAPKKRPIRLQCPRCERVHLLA